MVKRKDIGEFIVYSLAILFFVFKAFFYYSEVDMAPDAVAHMSYLYYEYQHPGEVIPAFEEMHMQGFDIIGDKAYVRAQTENICYLGHPPVYYRLLAMLGCVSQDANGVYLDLLRICIVNVTMVCLGLILCMEYGRYKLRESGGSLLIHALFAVIVVNVPLIPYLAGYITNDNLLYLAAGITIWGLEWGVQGKRGFKTYWTIALGVCLAVLTKLTLGLILLIAIVFVALYVMVKEKSIKLLWCKEFGSTMLLYILPCIYFVYQKVVYQSVQPGLRTISPETYEKSIWAVPSGITRTLGESVRHYWSSFWKTWTNVHSHYISQDKTGIYANVVYGVFAVLLLGFTVYALYILFHKKSDNKYLVVAAVNMGAICAMLYQSISIIPSYMNGGNGGYSARYYVNCVGVFALSAVMPINSLMNKQCEKRVKMAVKFLVALYIAGWIYYDFPYFLTSFSMYRELL